MKDFNGASPVSFSVMPYQIALYLCVRFLFEHKKIIVVVSKLSLLQMFDRSYFILCYNAGTLLLGFTSLSAFKITDYQFPRFPLSLAHKL